MATFVDFKAVKAAVSLLQVLERYGVAEKFKRSGDSLSGPCPIHDGQNVTQFRVSLDKNWPRRWPNCRTGQRRCCGPSTSISNRFGKLPSIGARAKRQLNRYSRGHGKHFGTLTNESRRIHHDRTG